MYPQGERSTSSKSNKLNKTPSGQYFASYKFSKKQTFLGSLKPVANRNSIKVQDPESKEYRHMIV